jgi:hypothetical protein
MKKLLLFTAVILMAFGANAQNRTWDFTGTWTINAETVDPNLSLDGNRFNYVPATTLQECVFASGVPIPDVAGLKFTQGGGSKLRLGFGSKLLYFNGGNIVVAIPCQIGDTVMVEAVQGNASATDRGFSVEGGTVNSDKTSTSISNGVITTANTPSVFAYNSTSTSLEMKTIAGGMNVSKITVIAKKPTAVSSVSVAKKVASVHYFNILGKEVSDNTKGLVIVKTLYADGTSAVEKQFRK